MNELVFSVENIFSTDSNEGALGRNQQAQKFFIAPYQRGYKWASNSRNAPVSVLMRDLWDAYENKKSEYYLQYITTQVRNQTDIKVLEVIDGQQRLTTLTLLFAVLTHLTGEQTHHITKDKLSYQVRAHVSRFFDAFIYNNIAAIIGKEWDEFIATNPAENEQDIYYLFQAIKKIYTELISKPETEHGLFAEYVRKNVHIILNNVDGNISCEKIFSNLNTNKVELTSADLIKGLLLTKVARELPTSSNYKEILELRAVIGRQWDEIAHWVNRREISGYYFKDSKFNSSPIDTLLLLLGQKKGFVSSQHSTDKYALFNFFQSKISKGKWTAREIFGDLKKMMYILDDWFQNDEIYNCLGFLFFAKSREQTVISDLLTDLELPKKELIQKFKKQVIQLLPNTTDYFRNGSDNQRLNLEYGNDNDEIHRTLLALSIFRENKRFDFVAFESESWTLEHIFPQQPRKLRGKLGPKDLELIKSLVGDNLDNEEFVAKILVPPLDETTCKAVKQILAGEDLRELTDIEKDFIYKVIKPGHLNSLGNMALLSTSDNTSNSNGMFDQKRFNLAKRVSEGSFVPKHTYDVFSKLISAEMTPDLSVWTEKDIEIHEKWITEKLKEITQKLIQI